MSRKRKVQPEDIVRNVINRMFEIAGHGVDYEDIVDRKDDWFAQWEMTIEQNEIWKEWMINYLRKECNYPAYKAKREANMISVMWGLKFKDKL